MMHVSGLVLAVLASASLAAEMLVVPRFVADEAVRARRRAAPDVLPDRPDDGDDAAAPAAPGPADRWSSVKVVTAGAAPLAQDLQRRFEALTGCRGPAVLRRHGDDRDRDADARRDGASPGSSGVAAARHDDRDPQPGGSRASSCRPASAARSPCAARRSPTGYWNRPEETAEFFAGGAFRSGDIGLVDDDGFLHVVDRLKDMIIASGYNVYPATVERAVFTHPAVAETIVIGVPDDYRGETVKAYVVLNPGHTLELEELQEHLAAAAVADRAAAAARDPRRAAQDRRRASCPART